MTSQINQLSKFPGFTLGPFTNGFRDALVMFPWIIIIDTMISDCEKRSYIHLQGKSTTPWLIYNASQLCLIQCADLSSLQQQPVVSGALIVFSESPHWRPVRRKDSASRLFSNGVNCLFLEPLFVSSLAVVHWMGAFQCVVSGSWKAGGQASASCQLLHVQSIKYFRKKENFKNQKSFCRCSEVTFGFGTAEPAEWDVAD